MKKILSTVTSVSELYKNYLDGGEPGWFAFVRGEQKFYEWKDAWVEVVFTDWLTISSRTQSFENGIYNVENEAEPTPTVLTGTLKLIVFTDYVGKQVKVVQCADKAYYLVNGDVFLLWSVIPPQQESTPQQKYIPEYAGSLPAVQNIDELYIKYPNGGEFGWYAFSRANKTFAFWDVDIEAWGLLSGGQGGGLQSLVAGSNITINWADPQNPVISAAAGQLTAQQVADQIDAFEEIQSITLNTLVALGGKKKAKTSVFYNFFKIAYDQLYAAATHTHAYSTITGLPTLFSGAWADITGKPTLFSGNYSDLSGKPTIPTIDPNTVIDAEYSDVKSKAESALQTIPTLTTPFVVNLSNNGKFGKLGNGTYNEAIGKTPEEWMRYAALESINPTASVSASGSIPYNSTTGAITVSLSGSSNNPGGTITNMTLSYRRGGGAWVQLYSGAAKGSHTHTVDSLLATDKVSNFSYQLIVTDSLSTTTTVTSNAITPATYSAPSCSVSVSGTRELGNISTLLSGTISQAAQNGVSITSRTLQYSLNNSTWVDIAAGTLTNSISYTHNDSALINATVIYYRIVIVCSTPDGNQTATLSLGSVSFVYKSVFGYDSSATPSLATILAMGNSALTNAKAKTVTATAPSGNYTYYAYCAAAGDLASIIMDDVTPVLGSFTKMTDVTGTNSYGATVTYCIYKSNAPAAFTSNNLVIS